LHKPSEPYNLEAHLDLSAAKVVNPSGKPPRSRRHFLGARRIAWAATQYTNDLTRRQTLPEHPRAATPTGRNRTVATPQRPAQPAPDPFARGEKQPLRVETSKPPQHLRLAALFMRPVSAPARPVAQRLQRGSPTPGPAP
jgi:hypothetical protein